MRSARVFLLLFVLLLPLTFANVQNYFFPGEKPEGYVVSCNNRDYDVYIVRSGGSTTAAIVLYEGNIVRDISEYNTALQTAWYYIQVSPIINEISFYTPDTAASLQSLANSLQNKEYDLALAKQRLLDLNLPEYAAEVEQLDAERKQVLEKVRALALDLSKASRDLLRFVRKPYCGFHVNISLYDRFENVYRLLSGYDQHARSIMASLAQMGGNSTTTAALAMIIKYISPPFDMGQIDSLRASAATERELFAQIYPLKNIKAMYEDALRRAARADYLAFISQRVSTVGNLEQTVQYILRVWPEEDPDRKKLEVAYNQMKDYARSGDYEAALLKAKSVEELVTDMIRRGPREESGLSPIVYLGAVVIFLVVIYIVWKRRGKGDEELEDTDFYA